MSQTLGGGKFCQVTADLNKVKANLWQTNSFQGKRHPEVFCHCLPLHHIPGLPWWFLTDVLTGADPAYLLSSDKFSLVWATLVKTCI